MSVDQRLHHAARELREFQVDIPEFTPPARRSAALPSVVASVLFVIGALGVLATDARDGGAPSPVAAVAAAPDAGPVAQRRVAPPPTDAAPTLTPRQEMLMIASIAGSRSAADGDAAPIPARAN